MITTNEVLLLAKKPVDTDALDLAVLAAQMEKDKILRHIRRSACLIDAGVAKPDYWALAQYIEKTLI